jgi:multiple sugar transport system substrate-binding protein
MKRKAFIVLVVTLSLLVFAAPLWASGEKEAEKTEQEGQGEVVRTEGGILLPQRYEGTTIDAYLVAEGRSELLKERVGQFEELTGITVNVTTLPYPNLQEKQFLELTQGGGPDVIHVDQVWLGQYQPYLEPVGKYLDNPDLTDKEAYRFDEILESVRELQVTYNDKVMGFPFIGAIRMMYYRSDLFEEYADEYREQTGSELTVPTTWEEYRQVARFFENNVDGVHGTTMMGRRGVQLYCEILPVIWSYGGAVIEGPNGEPAITEMDGIHPVINSEETKEAVSMFNSLKQYASEGVTDWDYDEAATAFAQGNAAMAMQWNNAAPIFANPERSNIIGDWEAAQVPGTVDKTGSVQRYATFGGWNLGINANSDKKEAAYLFIKWATSPEMDKALAAGGGNARVTTYKDPELNEQYKHYDALFQAYQNGQSRPRIPQYAEQADVAQTAFSQVLTGQKSVEQALNDAQRQLEDIDFSPTN